MEDLEQAWGEGEGQQRFRTCCCETNTPKRSGLKRSSFTPAGLHALGSSLPRVTSAEASLTAAATRGSAGLVAGLVLLRVAAGLLYSLGAGFQERGSKCRPSLCRA